MNGCADTKVNQAVGSQAAEGIGGHNATQGSSAEGMTKALVGGRLRSHKKHGRQACDSASDATKASG